MVWILLILEVIMPHNLAPLQNKITLLSIMSDQLPIVRLVIHFLLKDLQVLIKQVNKKYIIINLPIYEAISRKKEANLL